MWQKQHARSSLRQPQLSQLLIQQYLNELQTLRRVSGTSRESVVREALSRESVVREAFKSLLKDWGKSCDLIFIPEYEYSTLQKTRVYLKISSVKMCWISISRTSAAVTLGLIVSFACLRNFSAAARNFSFSFSARSIISRRALSTSGRSALMHVDPGCVRGERAEVGGVHECALEHQEALPKPVLTTPKLIPSSAARADPRGPAAEVADTAVGKGVSRRQT
jgi:hypothetical protein